jgi:hypothetical protein
LTEISLKDMVNIEMYTRGQNRNKRWFGERKKRFQSSNFHRMCTATEQTKSLELAKLFVKGNSILQNDAI